MPKLDEIQRQAGGWVWWLDGCGEQFVPQERWDKLAVERAKEPISNERLNLRIPATAASRPS